jgi:hypothetical protein
MREMVKSDSKVMFRGSKLLASSFNKTYPFFLIQLFFNMCVIIIPLVLLNWKYVTPWKYEIDAPYNGQGWMSIVYPIMITILLTSNLSFILISYVVNFAVERNNGIAEWTIVTPNSRNKIFFIKLTPLLVFQVAIFLINFISISSCFSSGDKMLFGVGSVSSLLLFHQFELFLYSLFSISLIMLVSNIEKLKTGHVIFISFILFFWFAGATYMRMYGQTFKDQFHDNTTIMIFLRIIGSFSPAIFFKLEFVFSLDSPNPDGGIYRLLSVNTDLGIITWIRSLISILIIGGMMTVLTFMIKKYQYN